MLKWNHFQEDDFKFQSFAILDSSVDKFGRIYEKKVKMYLWSVASELNLKVCMPQTEIQNLNWVYSTALIYIAKPLVVFKLLWISFFWCWSLTMTILFLLLVHACRTLFNLTKFPVDFFWIWISNEVQHELT